MADSKVTALTALAGTGIATGDPLMVVDVSDTTMDATGTNKKITADELAIALATTLGLVGRDKIWDTKGDIAAATGADAASKLAVGADGTVLQADSSQATGLAWKTRTRTPSATTTDTSAVNTTTETDVATQAIPTSVVAGDIVRLTAWGDLLNNTGGNVTYTPKAIVGATALTGAATTVATSASRRQWRCTVDILVVATNDERISAWIVLGNAAAGTWPAANGSAYAGIGTGRTTATEDLTAGKNAKLSITMGTASASADFICHESFLEVIKR